MNSIKTTRSVILGWLFIILIFYTLITVTLYAYSAIALANKQIVDVWPIYKYQQYFYHKAVRHIWQYDHNCAELSDDLIYQPKIGGCQFNNPEFETVLNFNSFGRLQNNRPATNHLQGIAVLGDSHAMGWGVNDDETFASVIQSKTNQPVYNLAVSSYGTHREIKRLIQTNLISKVDTIIIQYCENDLGENEKIGDQQAYEAEKEKFKNTFLNQKSMSAWEKIKLVLISLRAAVSEPFKSMKRVFVSKNNDDFSMHHQNLRKVLKYYETALKDKKIVIFYINGYEANFKNFPSGTDSEFENIRYHDFQKNLSKDNFYLLDGHLNPKGHHTLGIELANYLKLKQ